ncbi:hypothetical protein [Pantoea eucalypti]|uniref:hypothetical protein n=1 Tax=Pantoea eucalypti TaxID=470933 RepID=UPI0028997CF3|nr:hypothetical protein [Pantoea eucalypti]
MSTFDSTSLKTTFAINDIFREISISSFDFSKANEGNKDIKDINLNSSILEDYSTTSSGLPKGPNAETLIPQEIATQPAVIDKKKTGHLLAKKIQARIKEKVVHLDKALDTYGIIDQIDYTDKNRLISARIYDIHDHSFIDEISFESNEFSKSDRKKLIENAIFYWYVGLERNILGNERRVSEFRLRRVFAEK